MIVNALRRRWNAAIGPTVPLAEAPTSFRWARQTLVLKRRGIISADSVIRSADHIPPLILFQDEKLVDALAAGRLQPLTRGRPTQQHRLAETLLAWPQCGGNATEVASRLHLHPQTVRYRLRQFDQLFGGLPTGADERFELEITLRARRRTALARPVSRSQRLRRVIPMKTPNAAH